MVYAKSKAIAALRVRYVDADDRLHAQTPKVFLADALLAQGHAEIDAGFLSLRNQHPLLAHRLTQVFHTNDKRVLAYASYKWAA